MAGRHDIIRSRTVRMAVMAAMTLLVLGAAGCRRQPGHNVLVTNSWTRRFWSRRGPGAGRAGCRPAPR